MIGLFWFVACLGNLWALTQTIMFGTVFTVLWIIYERKPFWKTAGRYILLTAVGGFGFLLLAAHLMYSFVMEQLTVGYVREKSLAFESIRWHPDMVGLVNYIIGIIPLEGVPNNCQVIGVPYIFQKFSFAVIFPMVFAGYIFKRKKTFWEFVLTWSLLIFFIAVS